MNDSPKDGVLLAKAGRIGRFPAGQEWPATLDLRALAALLAGGDTGEQRASFRDWCTALRRAAKDRKLMTTTQREEIPSIRLIGRIGLAPQEFIPPPEPVFRDVLTVTREAAAAWLQDTLIPDTVAAWLASAPVRRHRLETDEDAVDKTAPVWVNELVVSWPQIVERYGVAPNAQEVLQWLCEAWEKKLTQPAWTTSSRSFSYLNQTGKEKKVAFKTLENRLSELRTAGKLPS